MLPITSTLLFHLFCFHFHILFFFQHIIHDLFRNYWGTLQDCRISDKSKSKAPRRCDISLFRFFLPHTAARRAYNLQHPTTYFSITNRSRDRTSKPFVRARPQRSPLNAAWDYYERTRCINHTAAPPRSCLPRSSKQSTAASRVDTLRLWLHWGSVSSHWLVHTIVSRTCGGALLKREL